MDPAFKAVGKCPLAAAPSMNLGLDHQPGTPELESRRLSLSRRRRG